MTSIYKTTIPLQTLIITCIIIIMCSYTTKANNFLEDEKKIIKDLQIIQQKDYQDNTQKKVIIDALQSALHFIAEKKASTLKIKEYQNIIDNFSYIVYQLHEEYNNTYNKPETINHNPSIHALKQKLFHINLQLTELSEQLKQEQKHARIISESIILLPQQQNTAKNELYKLDQKKILSTTIITPVDQAKSTALQIEQSAKRLKITELEFAQLSASNRKELSRIRIALLKKRYDQTDNELQILRNQLNNFCQKEAKQAIKHTEKVLSEQSKILPKCINTQLKINRELSEILIQQNNHINNIALKKRESIAHTLQVQQAFADLLEQSQWIHKSPALGETIRSQLAKLPKIPKSQQLDNDMAKLRAQRLQYEEQINKFASILLNSKQDDGAPLTLLQKNILKTQLVTQHNLITSILNSYDTQILEITKLKIIYEQLKETLREIKKATHRYLFWVADMHPINTSYLLEIYRDISKLLTQNKFHQHHIISLLHIIQQNQTIWILILFCIPIAIGIQFKIYRYHQEFLEHSNKNIGNVTQDNFLITFQNILYSLLIALPIPVLWKIIGYYCSHTWSYPIIVSIGDSMNSTTFMLWAFIVSTYFASPKGLFIIHFGWSKKKVSKVFSRNYTWSIAIIVCLSTTLTIFNNYNDREFASTLGRLCFIVLCIYLVYITKNLKSSGLPLYLNKYDSSNNIINHSLWNIMLCAPIIAAISCSLGYLSSAQTLLEKLETSLFIWILLLIIYHIIRRWISIQRRKIAFERAKQRRATKLTARTHNKLNTSTKIIKSISSVKKINKKFSDLDIISMQSLQLIRSILALIALLLMTLIWSELHSAFSFLENITLWDVTSTIKGVDNIQPITLNALLIAILVIIITTKTVRNLPAFLELTILQHLDLSPGTGYAITTLTKYTLMLLGSVIGFTLIGIEWVKIQWLIAALGVGLGFGLQEIFANLISGLMILFEKPIRIGDTITIGNLTGNVTQINTRATTITDWNHKEIIVPNKEFITKQFINWSLSDTVTRIVLKIPVPIQIDAKKMENILLQVIKSSPLALKKPAPEVFLTDLQQGLPIFEIRVHTADIKFRMPLCHQIHMLIIEYCQDNGFKLPYFPIYLYKDHQLSTDHLFSNFIKINS